MYHVPIRLSYRIKIGKKNCEKRMTFPAILNRRNEMRKAFNFRASRLTSRKAQHDICDRAIYTRFCLNKS